MVANTFTEVSLGDVADFRNGKAISPERYTASGEHPVLGSNGQIARSNDVLFSHPVVVIGRVGAYCGCVHYVSQASWVTDNAIVALPKDRNDVRYLFYLLSSLQLERTAIGSAQPLMTQGGLKVVRASVPSAAEQKAIASVLGALDDKIELNRRMNETLEALAQSLFKSWFVDATQSALPKGWRESRLDELCEIGRGSSPRPIHDFMGGDIPWIKIADSTAAGGPFIYETREFVTKEGSNRSVWVHPGDLILSNSATCGVPNFVDLDGCIHDGWLHFQGLQHISKHYLFHVLKEISEHLVHIADGSVQKNLNTALVGGQMILVPDKEKLKAFDDAVVPMFEKILRNGRESRTLAALRDTLLPKLLAGELRVPCTKEIVGKGA